jgi:tRNA (cmo5U34)-methyltransferase
MSGALNGFDRIAPIYDRLTRIVFGKSIFNSQIFFLGQLPENGKVLILGGGTGWIAAEVLKVKNVEIVLIDASEKMIAIAREQNPEHERIRFIHGTEANIPEEKFDGVITNFYFDLFETKELCSVVDRILSALTERSIWIATDFVNEKWWHSVHLAVMYTFFRITSSLKTKKLPDWQTIINSRFELFGRKDFFSGFIRTCCYRVS